MKKSIAIEQYEQGTPLLEVHPELKAEDLPNWLRAYVAEARVYGPSGQMVVLPDGRKYQLNNPLNDLSGGEWLKFTNSVESTWFPTSGPESYAHNIRKIHPTPKPPQLMKEIIEFFSKEGEGVLDFFAGVGGTLLGAALSGRNAVGIDLNYKYIEVYKAAACELGLKEMPTICADSATALNDSETLLELNEGRPFSLILIDPPYGDMMSRKKTGGDIAVYGEKGTPFTNFDSDLGNMDRETWLDALKSCIEKSLCVLKRRGYIVVFIKDLQPSKKNTNLLHAEIIEKLNEIPSVYYKGLKIWADRSAKLYPYGYPLSFVANQTHQYILIFRKEK